MSLNRWMVLVCLSSIILSGFWTLNDIDKDNNKENPLHLDFRSLDREPRVSFGITHIQQVVVSNVFLLLYLLNFEERRGEKRIL